MDVKRTIASMRAALDLLEKAVDENGAPRSLLPDDDRLAYTVAEVAKFLGNSNKTIYAWISDGELPTCSLPGNAQVRIPRWWVEETLAKRSA